MAVNKRYLLVILSVLIVVSESLLFQTTKSKPDSDINALNPSIKQEIADFSIKDTWGKYWFKYHLKAVGR